MWVVTSSPSSLDAHCSLRTADWDWHYCCFAPDHSLLWAAGRGGACPRCCWMFNSIPRLNLLDASRTPLPSHDNKKYLQTLTNAPCMGGWELLPLENHCSGAWPPAFSEWFPGRHFSHRPVLRGCWFQDDSSALRSLCSFFLFWFHPLHLRSSGTEVGVPCCRAPSSLDWQFPLLQVWALFFPSCL